MSVRTTDLTAIIGGLRKTVSGEVITPEHSDYDAVRQIFSGRFDGSPAAVVRARSATDVSRVVRAAAEHGIPLAVRSGGHSGAGHSTNDGGLVLDVRPLTALTVDVKQRTAHAGGGLTAAEYTTAVAEHGLATGFGDTGSVGISGITLGGGVGFLSRKHGLTVDSLLAAEIVTADGEIREVDASREPDLFWAIRGGGGNFGVLTRLTFRLHDVSQFTGGLLVLPGTPEVVAGFVREAAMAPDELSTIANVMPCPPMPFLPQELHGSLVVLALVAYAGVPAGAERALGALRGLATPVVDMVQSGGSYAAMFPPEEVAVRPTAVSRTMFLDGVDEKAAALIIDRLTASDAPMRAVQLRPLGGAIARVPADATAYAHRQMPVMANVASFYVGEADRPRREAWVRELSATLDQGYEGAYVNFLGDEGPERVRAAYPGETWRRLVEVKRAYDPHNLFRGNQNIPPQG
jgi:FAD/FMN-containing dehydrogenase